MIRRLVSVALAASVAACALPVPSYVAGIARPADAAVLTSAVADLIGTEMPIAGPAIALVPPDQAQADNLLTPALANALRTRGYALADASAPASRPVVYAVFPLENAMLIQVSAAGHDVTRLYARRSDGTLAAAAPALARAAEAAP